MAAGKRWLLTLTMSLDDPEVIARRALAEREAVAPAPEEAPKPPEPAIAAQRAMEGWYKVLRAGGKDGGCRLALLAATSVGGNGKAAALDQKCTDQGIRIFSPVAWRMDGETLILTARAGMNSPWRAPAKAGARRSSPEPLELLKLD